MYLLKLTALFACFVFQQIEKWMDRDYFMTADEAVAAGIVDRVLKEAPSAKIEVHNQPHSIKKPNSV
ncbi:hypothetical protein AHF37_12785 [Paragonimus kellicotti]|nr:hypothetical protein AHF37_12785 [Paragonimus kellicotti]